ncbi:unnamed protein product (macronuclear) [Paramecium tetraurelia]|uniref:Uncharacterized protein n=1 Tax=Paramecium tetraurelia TaxID=5888 RepID=A0D3J2_PARTE|nr:uncharacterized protein GSPATT00013097001 [Paramecium tetraurelia]CAK77609.1 unnamed protein product [Paramecium tetraurelia]|eukprot:XP_001445006.1 hypothetical protein (macronuclear) [Paramecium tetraurelia strain d4-2]
MIQSRLKISTLNGGIWTLNNHKQAKLDNYNQHLLSREIWTFNFLTFLQLPDKQIQNHKVNFKLITRDQENEENNIIQFQPKYVDQCLIQVIKKLGIDYSLSQILSIQVIISNYVRNLSCSVRTTPQQDTLNKSISIPKNENLYEIDGTKFPYGLYSMHKKRRDCIDDVFHNSKSQRSKNTFSNYVDSRISQSDQTQKENKQKEYTSRSFLDNAYFSIICAKNNCKHRIKIKIRDSLPKDSRFQQS